MYFPQTVWKKKTLSIANSPYENRNLRGKKKWKEQLKLYVMESLLDMENHEVYVGFRERVIKSPRGTNASNDKHSGGKYE